MSNLFMDSSALGTKGAQFNEYAANLTRLLSEISNNIEQISGGELKGSAVDSLVASYEEIKKGIENHIRRIDALGTVITKSAEERANIDSESATAAKGTSV